MEQDAALTPADLLRVDARGSATEIVITPGGELDTRSTEWFAGWVSTVLEKHPRSIAIDARGLTFMDSSGLRSLLRARASAHEAGVGFHIDNPSPQARLKVEHTGLQACFSTTSDQRRPPGERGDPEADGDVGGRSHGAVHWPCRDPETDDVAIRGSGRES